MIKDFSPIFSFSSVGFFTQMRRQIYQRQLGTEGILTQVDEPQIHHYILNNTIAQLSSQLKKGVDKLYVVNLQSKSEYFSLSPEPDLAITGPDDDTFLATPFWPNPYVVIEVLCPNQERDGKFKHYRQIASLREYVRIDLDHYVLEHFVKQTEWKRFQIENGEEICHLTSIDCQLSLATVYDPKLMTYERQRMCS